MGSDTNTTHRTTKNRKFQSTLPGWGATTSDCRFSSSRPYFNPRSPDGERPTVSSSLEALKKFQSTLPGWGATTRIFSIFSKSTNFNPRSPDGERQSRHVEIRTVSTHFNPRSPDGERLHASMCRYLSDYFNPRSPDGERPVVKVSQGVGFEFQSTLPGWGATSCDGLPGHGHQHFNPRSPDGERPYTPAKKEAEERISIHAPRMGSDPARPASHR